MWGPRAEPPDALERKQLRRRTRKNSRTVPTTDIVCQPRGVWGSTERNRDLKSRGYRPARGLLAAGDKCGKNSDKPDGHTSKHDCLVRLAQPKLNSKIAFPQFLDFIFEISGE